MKSLGRVAFEAYSEARGGRNHDGTPTPTWEELGDGVRSGWDAAASAVGEALAGEALRVEERFAGP